MDHLDITFLFGSDEFSVEAIQIDNKMTNVQDQYQNLNVVVSGYADSRNNDVK